MKEVTNPEVIKKYKIAAYASPECLFDYHDHRFSHPLGKIRDKVERDIVLENVRGLVLDAGAGEGRFSIPLAEHGGNTVVALDTSLEMLKTLRKKMEARGIRNVRLVIGDIENTPFREGTFDGVVSVHVLFHMPRYREISRELMRVTKRSGTLALEMSSRLYQQEVLGPIRGIFVALGLKKMPEKKNRKQVYFYDTPAGYSRFLRKSGAGAVRNRNFDIPNSFWFIATVMQKKLMQNLLAIPAVFRLFNFLDLHLSKFLPSQVCPRFFSLIRKR